MGKEGKSHTLGSAARLAQVEEHPSEAKLFFRVLALEAAVMWVAVALAAVATLLLGRDAHTMLARGPAGQWHSRRSCANGLQQSRAHKTTTDASAQKSFVGTRRIAIHCWGK